MSDLTLRDFYKLFEIDEPEKLEREATAWVAGIREQRPGGMSLSLEVEYIDIYLREALRPYARSKGLVVELERLFEGRILGVP